MNPLREELSCVVRASHRSISLVSCLLSAYVIISDNNLSGNLY